MSYRIEYDWAAIRLPKERIESAYEDHFILASLGGTTMSIGRMASVLVGGPAWPWACPGRSCKP